MFVNATNQNTATAGRMVSVDSPNPMTPIRRTKIGRRMRFLLPRCPEMRVSHADDCRGWNLRCISLLGRFQELEDEGVVEQ